MEADVRKSAGEKILPQRAGDATAPEFGIALHRFGYIGVAHNVGNDGATAGLEDAEYLAEKLTLSRRRDKIQYAVRNDNIHRIAGDKRGALAQFFGKPFGGKEGVETRNRLRSQFMVE